MHGNICWLYFNIHNLVRMRVEAGHISERSIRLVFGHFEVDSLDKVDITLQYKPPEVSEYSFASESYIFTDRYVYIKDYKLHLIKNDDEIILASQRDLLPFVPPILQFLLMRYQCCFVHSAAVSIEGNGVLLPGWGGTGKTSAVICLLKEIPTTCFMSDDYAILSSDHKILSFPKAFFIYPYHRKLFPYLFKSKHKFLVPSFLSSFIERLRVAVRPTVMAYPKLEYLARRFTPEHMQVPAKKALPDSEFIDIAPLHKVLFIERYSGEKILLDELDLLDAARRLIGNWYYEQGRCAQDLLLGAAGTSILDFEQYFSGMSFVIKAALNGKKIYRLRMGAMTPDETGKKIIDAIREVVVT